MKKSIARMAALALFGLPFLLFGQHFQRNFGTALDALVLNDAPILAQTAIFETPNGACQCGTFSNMSYRFGGAQNFPTACGATFSVPATAPLAIYADFQCAGATCSASPQIDWKLFDPLGSVTQNGTTNPQPNFTFLIPGGSFALAGTYSLEMTGYCGSDTCHCTLSVQSSGVCCQDSLGFLAHVAQGFTIQNFGCNVIVTAPQFGICQEIDATLDWGDGTPLVVGTVPAGFSWTHTYQASVPLTYNVCATVKEVDCWSATMCTQVPITCYEFCQSNPIQNSHFNVGTPNGFDESILLANKWGSIWPANLGKSTGDFFNALTAPPISPLAAPLPSAQGNFGGFWCALQPGQAQLREGIMNELSSVLPNSTVGNYSLTFKMACLSPRNGSPSLSIYGVSAPSLASGILPIDEATPPNLGLFPAGAAAPMVAAWTIPATCDANFNTLTFGINPALFPASGVSHIFFTRTDNQAGDVYLAIDDVCLSQILPIICCDNQTAFGQLIDNEVSIKVGNNGCTTTLKTGDLADCDAILDIKWGDGNMSAGPFLANETVSHNYLDSGNFAVSFSAVEKNGTGAACFQTTRSQTVAVNCQNTCPCESITNLSFSPNSTGGTMPLVCGGDLPLACQNGTTYLVNGTLNCFILCNNVGSVVWKLTGPQGVVDMGTAVASPNFSIPLPSGYFYQTGAYTLEFEAICGNWVGLGCQCKVHFQVTQACPALCPCNLAQFQNAVNAGFSTIQNALSPCQVCFKPIALTPCDMVEWQISQNNLPVFPSSFTTGNQSFCKTLPNSGTYTICMIVIRKKGLNSFCESAARCLTRPFNCSPIIVDCSKPKVFNPNFDENPVAGTLGSGGSAPHWEKVGGSPKLEKLPTGEWVMTLAANADGSDAIRSQEQICLEKDTGNIALTMRYDLPPGQFIVKIALVRGDDFSVAAKCDEWGPTCFEVAEFELETSNLGWKTYLFHYDLAGAMPADNCLAMPAGLLVRPVISFQNAGVAKRSIQIDRFCLEAAGTTISTNEAAPERSIRLFPNPNKGDFRVEWQGFLIEKGQIEIVSSLGQTVRKRLIPEGSAQYDSEVGDLPEGIYFVKITSRGQLLKALKFVKQ